MADTQEFVALGHAGSEAYAGLESFPNPGVARVEMRSADELKAELEAGLQASTEMNPITIVRRHRK